MMQIIRPVCKSTVRWLSVFVISMFLVSNIFAHAIIPELVFPLENVPATLSKKDIKQLDCLARNIYYESATESWEGKIAVGQVTMNRLDDGGYGADVCAVVYQRTPYKGLIVCQFSWTCQIRGTPHLNNQWWEQSKMAAYNVYVDQYRLKELETALFFHSVTVNPRWHLRRIKQIGNHIFYGFFV